MHGGSREMKRWSAKITKIKIHRVFLSNMNKMNSDINRKFQRRAIKNRYRNGLPFMHGHQQSDKELRYLKNLIVRSDVYSTGQNSCKTILKKKTVNRVFDKQSLGIMAKLERVDKRCQIY